MSSTSARRSISPRRGARPAVALPIVAAIGALAAWTPVHVRLESSVPAADAVLEAPPERIELRFSGAVEPALSFLVLVYPSGDSLAVPLRGSSVDGSVLLADPPAFAEGVHVLLWSTVSADGHPARGEIRFTMATTAGTPDAEERTEAGTEIDARGALEVEGARPPTLPADAAEPAPPIGRTLLGGLGLACLLGFAGLLWHAGGTLLSGTALRRSCRILGWAALVLLSLELGAWLLEVDAVGAGTGGWWAGLSARTGTVSAIRLALLLAAILALGRRGRVSAILGLAALLAGAAAGHAAGTSPWITVPSNAVHLGAAAIWLGGLLLIVLLPDRPDSSDGPHEPEGAIEGGGGTAPPASFAAVATSVSAAALLAVLLVAASGIVQSVLYVGDLEAFTTTSYGRLVLIKWAGLAALVGFGAWHRFRVMPRMSGEGGDGSTALRRSVRLETAVFLLVVLVAAFLAHVPPPAAG